MACNITHVQRVTRLYRRCLKNQLSWAIDRHYWRQEAVKLRAIFDANKDLRDVNQIKETVEYGEKALEALKHPQPYIYPEAPGGSKWERNLPPPPHVLEMTPEEQQWYEDACRGFR